MMNEAGKDAKPLQPRAGSSPEPDPRAILNSIGEAVYDWDLVSDRMVFGPNTAEIPDLAEFADLPSGRAYAERLAPESPSSRFEAITTSIEPDTGRGVPYRVVYGLVSRTRGRDGQQKIIWIEDSGRWFAGPNDRPAHAHGLIRVVTDRYEAERQLARRSRCDALTGALNRAHFMEHITGLLPESIRKGGAFAIMLVAIDDLSAVNASYGYAVGDELIAAVASRLRSEMRAADLIARFAGNKFALCLQACNGEQMQVAASRFLSAIEKTPLQTSAGSVAVAARIGGIIAPQHGRTAQIALHHAEEALEATRRSGGLRFIAYMPSLLREDARRHLLQTSEEIVAALNESRIVLALQPIVAARTREISFYEGLARIDNGNGGPSLPAHIFPVAEQTGLVRLIDQRILDLAIAELNKNLDLHLAVNASGTTILDPHWPEKLQAACALYPGIAARLTIEITETSAIHNIEAVGRAIATMQACGVRVAMDDFGAGHTSFRNLRNLRVDLLKIDGAFIQNLARSEDDRFFVRTLVDLAHHLAIPTVAEWVEDAESAAILADWGVDYLQGYYFGEPQTISERKARAVA